MKRLAILTAAVALGLTPQAAVAKKPQKTGDRAAKVERTSTKGASAQQRCRDERAALGAPAFAAKYGKARTKGSAKAKAKAARAAFGRCVSRTAKQLRAEREAAEEAELAAEEAALDAEDAELDAEEDALDDDGLDDDSLDEAELEDEDEPGRGRGRDKPGRDKNLDEDDDPELDLAGDSDDE